jgi:hypothetical protein
MTKTLTPLFELGQIVATPEALQAMNEAGQIAPEFLRRHVCGDWGECDWADAKENELSAKNGFRILSVYKTHLNEKLWIITEADRSSTCLLLPSNY